VRPWSQISSKLVPKHCCDNLRVTTPGIPSQSTEASLYSRFKLYMDIMHGGSALIKARRTHISPRMCMLRVLNLPMYSSDSACTHLGSWKSIFAKSYADSILTTIATYTRHERRINSRGESAPIEYVHESSELISHFINNHRTFLGETKRKRALMNKNNVNATGDGRLKS
jgi:hypothetical protein